MKKVIWIIIIIAISVIAVSWFMPKPLGDSEIQEVVLVQANLNYGAQDSKLEYVHFIPDRIIECLNKYKEQPTFTRHNGYAMKDVQLRIAVRTNEGLKDIIIGKDTYSQKGTGPSYRILEREKFIKEIFDLCGYTDLPAENSGTTMQFGYNNLKVDVSSVSEATTETATDGFDSWEYAVYKVYPGAKVTVKDADMWADENGELHSNWAFYTKDHQRINIVDGMEPVTVTDNIEGIFDTESSVFVLRFIN